MAANDHRSDRIPDDELLDELWRMGEPGDPPTTTDVKDEGRYSLPLYYQRWDDFDTALEAAGYVDGDTVTVRKRATTDRTARERLQAAMEAGEVTPDVVGDALEVVADAE